MKQGYLARRLIESNDRRPDEKPRRIRPFVTALLACALVAAVCAFNPTRALAEAEAKDNTATVDGKVDFARDVQPLLARYCVRCHGPEKQESGLRLHTAAALRIGGDSGPVVEPKKVDASRLIVAVRGGSDEVSRMPPEGELLEPDEIALLERWITAGAAAGDDETVATARSDHWAFQRPVRSPLPAVDDVNWPRNAIDYFILARLEQQGIEPAGEADRATLARRLSLDLIGLPPSPEDVEAFVNDDRPDAYEQLVERLLASPHYGERWGRHWLDAARYADSNGFTRDFAREIWKYREWVVAALNRDQPFDRFTIEQYAGDLLADATLDQRIATGFHRNTLINEEGGTDPEQFRVDAVADRVATTGSVFLGLTLDCARCHSHKYDPISQREYYQLFAFLNNCDEPKIDAPYDWQIESGDLQRRKETRRQIAELQKQLDQDRSQLEASQLEWERAITPEYRMTLPGPVQSALMVPLAERIEEQRRLVFDVFAESEVALEQFPILAEMTRLRNSAPGIPTTMVLSERATPRETFVHLRGDFLAHGSPVQPAVPSVLHPLPDEVEQPNRLDLAHWLISPDNPLTPRVIVNRDWQHLFGRGLVETEDDFGTQGSPPTHPELLDWLAVEFLDQQWSRKAMHRLIVTSATYRQSSRHRAELSIVDPRNLLLARQSRLRLDAEVIRDSALTASGLLTRKLGGPSVHPPQPEGVFDFTQDKKPWNTAEGEDRYRRGMYTFFWRSSPYPGLSVFDAPNANVTCTRRVRSNTPLQALTLANDTQFVECARALALRACRETSEDDGARAERLFQLCLARLPRRAESERLEELVQQQRAGFEADESAARGVAGSADASEIRVTELATWTAVARVLLNVDEFITRE